MLQVFPWDLFSYIRVHPNVAGLYFGKILHINLLSIFVVVAGVPSQIPMSTFSVVPILRTIVRNMFNALVY